MGQFQPNLAQRGIQVCSKEGPRPCPKGDKELRNSENTLTEFKIFSFKQTYYKASSSEGIQVCSDEGPCPFPRGVNNEI